MTGWQAFRRRLHQRAWWVWAFEIFIIVGFFITIFAAIIVLEMAYQGATP